LIALNNDGFDRVSQSASRLRWIPVALEMTLLN
jgi:hypothetical protein